MRTLQCVLPSPGRVFSVVSRMRCSKSGVSTFGDRLRRRIPVTAVTPFLAKAARNASTVGREIFNWSAMLALATPSCASSTTLQRRATFCGELPFRTNSSSSRLWSSVTVSGAAALNMSQYTAAQSNCKDLFETGH